MMPNPIDMDDFKAGVWGIFEDHAASLAEPLTFSNAISYPQFEYNAPQIARTAPGA